MVAGPTHTGSGALQGAASASDTAQCGQSVAVQPNTSYALSAWVQGGYVYLGATGAGVTDPAAWTSSPSGWSQLNANFTTGPSTTSVTVYLHGWYGQGSYLADDVQLTAPAPTPTPTPTPTPSPTPTPTPTPTPAPTGSSTPAPNVPMPLAPYVDMGAWPTPSLTADSAGSGIKSFTLAFVTSVGCKASWFNAYDPRAAWAKDQIDAIRASGGDVKVSFGGASGTELAAACPTVDALFAEYDAVVSAYNLKYVDFDIEGAAVSDTAANDRRSAALARLQQAHPGLKISLTLPVLPEGLTSDGLAVVKSAISAGVNLDLVNVMAMDYGRSGVNYGDAAVRAAQSTHDQLAALYPGRTDAQLWASVGLTPMIGENDDHNVFDLAAAQQVVTFAQQHHLGELAFWELSRDANACTGGALYKCTNVPQQPYDFSKIFAKYTG